MAILTFLYKSVPEGFIGWVVELPGANAQGATLAETRRNLREAVAELRADVADARRALETPVAEWVGWEQLKAEVDHAD